MAKAILELEMPESCWEYPCIQDRTETYRWCGAVGGDCPNPPYEKRRDDCPLKYEDEIVFIDDSDNIFRPDDIGKTVFLTREAAEKALEVRE